MKREAGDDEAPPAKRQKGEGIFKADGTQIKNPVAYVAGIQKRGYNDKLFGPDGSEIRDPVAYVAGMQRRGQVSGPPLLGKGNQAPMQAVWVPNHFPMQTAMHADKPKGIFKADGTQIRNPVKFVEGIEKNGHTQALYDANGSEIRDPVRYVAGMVKRGDVDPSGNTKAFAGGPTSLFVPMPMQSSVSKGHGKTWGEGIFKADGTRIKNPVAFVAGIEKNGQSQPLFDSNGSEIRNPSAYVAGMVKRGHIADGPSSTPVAPKSQGNATKSKGIFKGDGTPIKNPSAYVAGIEKNGQKEPLYDADGAEIRNPVAYVAGMVKRGDA